MRLYVSYIISKSSIYGHLFSIQIQIQIQHRHNRYNNRASSNGPHFSDFTLSVPMSFYLCLCLCMCVCVFLCISQIMFYTLRTAIVSFYSRKLLWIFANSGNSKAHFQWELKVEIAIAIKAYFAIISVKITFHFIEHFIAINVCIFTHKLLLEICNCPWEKCFAKSLTNDIDNLYL